MSIFPADDRAAGYSAVMSEDDDGQLVFHAKGKCRHVHGPQVFRDTFWKVIVSKLLSSGFFGVGKYRCVSRCLLRITRH